MLCPNCGAPLVVYRSRVIFSGAARRRVRHCTQCVARYSTTEVISITLSDRKAPTVAASKRTKTSAATNKAG